MKSGIENSFTSNEPQKNDLTVNTLNNDLQEEEDEEIEDQKRRNEELRDLLEVAFTDITNEISDDESDNQNSIENVSADISNLNREQLYPAEASSSETVNYLFNRQELDDIYKQYRQNEQSTSGSTLYLSGLSSPLFTPCQSRRRQVSSQRISQLSPLKEVDHNTTDDSIPIRVIEPSDSSSHVLSMQTASDCPEEKNDDSRVQELRTLTDRVKELQCELERIKVNHNKVVDIKNSELEQLNTALESTRKLLVETQIKLREAEDDVKSLKYKQEKTDKQNESLQCELKGTHTKVTDLENEITCLKQQLQSSVAKNEEIEELERKFQQQIVALKKMVDEKDEVKSDLENRLCQLTLSYNKVLAERNDIYSRFNETSTKMKNLKEENKEITRQLEQKINENENLKKTNQGLTQKFQKLIPELRKILNFNLDEKSTSYTSTKSEIDLDLDQLKTKIDEMLNMKKTNQELSQKFLKLIPELQKILNFSIDGKSPSYVTSVDNEMDLDLDQLKMKIDEILNMKMVIEQQNQLIRELESTYRRDLSSRLTQTEEGHTNIKRREEQLRQYKDIIKVLKKKLDDLVQKDQERQSSYQKLQEDYNQLSMDYFKRGDQIEELQSRIKSLDATIEQLKQNQIDHQLSEKFQTELHTIVQKYEQLKKAFTDLNQKLLATEKENTTLKTTLNQNIEQIKFLKNRIEMYEENSATFQDLLQSLNTRRKESEDRLKEMSKVEEENTLLKEKLKDVKCNYALACKELETMYKHASLVSEKDELVEKVSELTRQEQELEVKVNKKIEELYQICQKIHHVQKECCATLQTSGSENVSACISRISQLEAEIKQLAEERDTLKQTIVHFQEKDKERVYEIEKLASLLKQSQEETRQIEEKAKELQRQINTHNNITQQLKHLEDVVTERLKRAPSSRQDADVQVSTSCSGEQLLAIEKAYKIEIESLQKSFKTIMCRELQALQADYGAKITKLETEKKYLEQSIQSMDQYATETIKGINSEKEAIKNTLNKVLTQLSTFGRREADWKQKQETLEKEKQVLQRGVDKFARTMLEFYVKYQKMRGDIKRIKDEKFTYYEYARSLKKKITKKPDCAQQPRVRRALSESSIITSESVDEILIVPEIQEKVNPAGRIQAGLSQKKKLIKPSNALVKGKAAVRDNVKSSDLNKQKQLRQSKLVQR